MKRTLLLVLTVLNFAGGYPVTRFRALDNSGDPCNGCLLYTYSVGTTTNKATYSDDGLTSANANPIVADSSGIFGQIYLLEDECYKFVLKDSTAATTYWTEDDVCGTQLTSSSIQTRINQATSNPLDQGAAGDGSTDDTTAVQAALDAATNVVDLLGKTYRISSVLTMSSNQKLQNGTLDFSQDSNGALVIAGSLGSSMTLESDLTAGTTTVDVPSTSGLSVGDLVHVGSSDTWTGTLTIGELAEIATISAGSFTIVEKAMLTYQTADTAVARALTTIENVVVDNVTFTGSTANTDNPINVQYGRNVVLHNVLLDGFASKGVLIQGSRNVRVTGSTFSNGGSTATGVYIEWASRDIEVSHCSISNMYIGIVVTQASEGGIAGGLNTNLLFDNNVIASTNNSSISTTSSRNVYVRHNVLDGGRDGGLYGFISLDVDFWVEGNRFTDLGHAGVGGGVYVLWNGDAAANSMVVRDNYFYNIGDAANEQAIELTITNSSAVVNAVDVSDNIIVDAYDAGIHVVGTSGAEVFSILVGSNSIELASTAAEGIFIDQAGGDFRDVRVVDNHLRLAGAAIAIDIDAAFNASVSRNQIIMLSAGSGITIDVDKAANLHSIEGNSVNCISGACTGITYDNSNSTGTKQVIMGHNTVLSAEVPFSMAGYASFVAITGNIFDNDDDTDVNATIAGDASNAIDYMVIANNTFSDGTYGLSISNTQGPHQAYGNNFISLATGNYTGTTLGGLGPVSVTGDPCGDTVNFPSGTVFYNGTSGYLCFCNNAGADIKTVDDSTACF